MPELSIFYTCQITWILLRAKWIYNSDVGFFRTHCSYLLSSNNLIGAIWITMTKSQPMIDHQPLYQFHLNAVSDDQLMLNSSTFWTACSMKKCASHWDDMSVTGRLTVGPTDKFKMETADYTTTFLYLHRWAIGLRCSSREFTKA